MVIVFYSASEGKIYICSPSQVTQVIDADNPEWINSIPNDDILYVTNGHFFTKPQFCEWLQNQAEGKTVATSSPGNVDTASVNPNRLYIHPTGNGTVLIEDIRTTKFPEGITLTGKWDFVAVDEVGADVLEDSPFYRSLIKVKKIEVVNDEYYQRHIHKKKTKVSPTEAALNKILIKDSTPGAAGQVAADGGLDTGDNVAIAINVV